MASAPSTLLQRYTQSRVNQYCNTYTHRSLSQRFSSSTNASATKLVTEAAAPEQAGRKAGEVVQNAAASGELPPSFLPTNDTWTKTVGTLGALANWTIPGAAITHMTTKPAETIDWKMTTTLGIYSCFFMRWALAVTPPNFPLLLCHFSNVCVQSTQLVRYAMADKSGAHSTAAPATASSSTPALTSSSSSAATGTSLDRSSQPLKIVPGERRS